MFVALYFIQRICTPYIFKKNLVAGFSKVFHRYGNCLTKKSSHENFPLRLQTGGMKEKVTSSFSSIKSQRIPQKTPVRMCVFVACKKAVYIYRYIHVFQYMYAYQGTSWYSLYPSLFFFYIFFNNYGLYIYIYTFNIYIYISYISDYMVSI